jgi:serine protease inhibitor
VSRATKGRITEMVSAPLSDAAVAVLMNAVYFKGSWQDAFEPGATMARPFRTGARTIEKRPAMTRVGTYAYARRTGFQVLRLPYRGGRFGMYVLLPDATTPLDSLTTMLGPVRSAEWMAALSTCEVHLQLPKFKLDYAVDLVGPLTSLGMGVAFDSRRASFGRMLPADYLARRNVFISSAAQKTFVAVNEEGTEAAAATAMVLSDTAAPAPPVPFIVDRPFLFLIREESRGTVLFIGRIVDPR